MGIWLLRRVLTAVQSPLGVTAKCAARIAVASGGCSTPFVVAITGLSMMASDISTKRLQLLKEAIPALKRVGVVWDASIPWHESTLVDLVRAAGKLGVQITPVRVKDTDDFASTFSQMRRARVQALFMLDSALLGSHSVELLKLAGEARLPVACGRTKWAEARVRPTGGAPIKFEFVLNLRTAKTLGLGIPESVLVQANDMIR